MNGGKYYYQNADWQDPDTLWKAIDAQEKRVDAPLGWQLRLNLPLELTQTQQMALLIDYANTYFLSQDLIVDLALPTSLPHKASLLMTARPFAREGWEHKKVKNGK